MPRANMPPDWKPPAPAWESLWSDTEDALVAGYFGIQSESPDLLDGWAGSAFTAAYSPFSVERGSFVDAQGDCNFLYVAYWRASHYHRWWASNGSARWWRKPERISEGVGYWREVCTLPFERLETLHSTTDPHGASVSADSMQGPILEHGYAGAMRDRIPLSATDSLENPLPMKMPLTSVNSDQGKRIKVKPNRNTCIIRSGQDWSHCDAEQKSYYLEKLHPVLLEGMAYLRDNPIESGCYSLRFVDCRDETWGTMEQSFGLGYATDAYAFENWAKSHPTHLAIFDGFLKMVEVYGESLKLQLWHEVAALPVGGSEFEYIGCHPRTGLLPYI